MLFLLMKPGVKFTAELVERVKDAIAKDVGRRCVPKFVFETPEIPVSKSVRLVCGQRYEPNNVICRPQSTSRKWSSRSSKSCPERRSSLPTRWRTRSVWTSIINLQTTRGWVEPKKQSGPNSEELWIASQKTMLRGNAVLPRQTRVVTRHPFYIWRNAKSRRRRNIVMLGCGLPFHQIMVFYSCVFISIS